MTGAGRPGRRRSGGTGRRAGLKIPCPQGHEGSTPSSGTILNQAVTLCVVPSRGLQTATVPLNCVSLFKKFRRPRKGSYILSGTKSWGPTPPPPYKDFIRFCRKNLETSNNCRDMGGKNDLLGIREPSPSGRSFDCDLQPEESGILERISQRDRISFPERSAGITPRSLFHRCGRP